MCDRSSVTFDLRQCVSPRVRGNPASRFICDTRSRSIPACAGEPPCLWTPSYRPWVYPRVCGGTTTRELQLTGEAGLSPRVRGNQDGAEPAQRDVWSIPACAGEPCHKAHLGGTAEVYPRVCGGTFKIIARQPIVWGLSPRVWGNHYQPACRPLFAGSIPACAGEPSRLLLGNQ